jgi:hypothetical protein
LKKSWCGGGACAKPIRGFLQELSMAGVYCRASEAADGLKS